MDWWTLSNTPEFCWASAAAQTLLQQGQSTVATSDVQFWFRRFRSGIFDFKDAPRTVRPVVENIDKITEIIQFDLHVSSRSIPQELKIDHKTVLNHLRKVEFKKKLDVWVPHQLT
ncbi:histone-lysine N-methyltransferase SETMAR [Trichonephila clavipes]|nr:histone-lysine N-methyltransferase SETMAR [Trichonephila clavipes]